MSHRSRIEQLERRQPPAGASEPIYRIFLPLKGDGTDPSIGPPLGRTLSNNGQTLMVIYRTLPNGRRVTRDEAGNLVDI